MNLPFSGSIHLPPLLSGSVLQAFHTAPRQKQALTTPPVDMYVLTCKNITHQLLFLHLKCFHLHILTKSIWECWDSPPILGMALCLLTGHHTSMLAPWALLPAAVLGVCSETSPSANIIVRFHFGNQITWFGWQVYFLRLSSPRVFEFDQRVDSAADLKSI